MSATATLVMTNILSLMTGGFIGMFIVAALVANKDKK